MVQKHKPGTAHQAEAMVAVGAQPHVGMVIDHHARVAPLELARDIKGVIRRAVVENQKLQVTARLLQDALHRLRQIVRRVVSGDHDGEEGRLQRILLAGNRLGARSLNHAIDFQIHIKPLCESPFLRIIPTYSKRSRF